MKKIREIITDLNVVRSNNCSKEKSEEIKKVINDLLPYAEQQETKKKKVKELTVGEIAKICAEAKSCMSCPLNKHKLPCNIDFELITKEQLDSEVDL